ncbi:MAG: F0F1 ATP synthase subunit alpha [Fibrobacter sp.]|nr:F0F1 ATP synthase subunit alpha [Fibrobacter sp.]
MDIEISKVTGVIEESLRQYQNKLDLRETGYVLQVGDGIARIFGLEQSVYGELVRFPHDVYGLVLNLEQGSIGCIILGDTSEIKEGDEVYRTGKVVSVPVGDELLGRVVSPLGEPIDGKGPINSGRQRPIEVIAPGVMERQPVKQPLQTGIKAIDSMIPIGRGQRELIIGDRQIGKTALAIDTIINQKNQPNRPVCIYVAVGQKLSSVAQVIKTLQDHGAMEYSVVVSATASDPAPLQYIAPYAGCAIGEEFMWKGKDVLIIYDDLTRHAQAYRQLSLLLRRPPGREAYPGDVFYLHSRLLERACKLSEKNGGGSITALPIIETQAGDISSYIPTNVISITDGQIYLETGLFYSGIRPAINVGLSVSRVGGNAQIKAMRQVAGSLRIDLAQFNELAAFAQFGSELDPHSQAQLSRGERLRELLKQDQLNPLPVELQVIIIFAGVNGFIDDVAIEDIRSWESEYVSFILKNYPSIPEKIKEAKVIDDQLKNELKEAINRFKAR